MFYASTYLQQPVDLPPPSSFLPPLPVSCLSTPPDETSRARARARARGGPSPPYEVCGVVWRGKVGVMARHVLIGIELALCSQP